MEYLVWVAKSPQQTGEEAFTQALQGYASCALSCTIKIFTLPCFPVFPNNLLCHTVLLCTHELHIQTCALSILWCRSAASAKMSCWICSPSLSSKYNKASPASLQTSSRALLSSCCQENLKALHSWCRPFLPSPALRHGMYVLFFHIEVSCKDNLDYSLLALRINWTPSMQPWLQCFPSH